MKKSIELVKSCNDIYGKILELSQLGFINQTQTERAVEDLKNIKGLLAQSALDEVHNVGMIQKDAIGYLPIKN